MMLAMLCVVLAVLLLAPRRMSPVLRPPLRRWPSLFTTWLTPAHWRIGALAGLVSGLLIGPDQSGLFAALLTGPVTVAVLVYLETRPARLRRRQLRHQLPQCLTLMMAAVESGLPTSAAARHLSLIMPQPSCDVLAGVVARLEIGFSEAAAWKYLAGDPIWGPVAKDIARAVITGSGISELLAAHAKDAADSERGEALAEARAVGVKAVLPLVVCYLPAFLLVGVVPIIASLISNYLS